MSILCSFRVTTATALARVDLPAGATVHFTPDTAHPIAACVTISDVDWDELLDLELNGVLRRDIATDHHITFSVTAPTAVCDVKMPVGTRIYPPRCTPEARDGVAIVRLPESALSELLGLRTLGILEQVSGPPLTPRAQHQQPFRSRTETGRRSAARARRRRAW